MRFPFYLLIVLFANVYVFSFQLRTANSCRVYREMIAQAVKSAQIRAAKAHIELMVWDDPRIQRWANRLFGSSIRDPAVRTEVGNIFRDVAMINFMNDRASQPLWDDDTPGQPGLLGDFIIYCDYSRFFQDANNPQFWYDRNNSVRMNAQQRQISSASPWQGGSQLYSWQWRDPITSRLIAASRININTWHLLRWSAEWNLVHGTDASELDAEISWAYPIWFDLNGDAGGEQEEVDAAVREILSNHPGSWMTFWQSKLDAVLLHELSHMVAPGGRNIADTYSQFATVVKLIDLGYHISSEGKWRK
ncbi:6-phosphogluconate dehydrogenase [Venturia nashicola]|uniref:6-phosphogluconate dehydrogenase n=1 Tax=Venturia nashicola TaxID=86259 RepID=A0A4Z1NUU9_9PEZI|nr:6-phosphogluconate dehydrogenase [Venturia nashicola]TLD30168.1 6-phosphogluconate dehydrogenase [Venturia nashicola]